MPAVLGKDFKLYRNTDSPYDNIPTWGLVVNIKDLTRNVEKSLADASIRGSSFRQQIGTLKDLTIDFQMVYDPADTDLIAYEAAFYSDANVETLILDGLIATTGSKGIRFMAQITKFSVSEALEDVGLVDVSMVVGYDSANLARRVNVASPNVLANS